MLPCCKFFSESNGANLTHIHQKKAFLAKRSGSQWVKDDLLFCFAGAGKTYTMVGTDKDPGVNIRSILELLRVCDERKNVDYSMCVSMVEVYNETVRDLLSENSSSQQLNIQMRNKQLVITDVTEVDVKSADDIKSIMQKGVDLC